MKRYLLAITGASGALYARQLLDFFATLSESVLLEVITSKTGEAIFSQECGKGLTDYPFTRYDAKNLFAPCASGSVRYDAMIIAPCSMGTLGRIASGISDNLISRTADVFLKEKRPLVLVPRETPWNLIHIENCRTLLVAGAHMVPASPSFYTSPQTIEELALTVTVRVLDYLGLEHPEAKRWKKPTANSPNLF